MTNRKQGISRYPTEHEMVQLRRLLQRIQQFSNTYALRMWAPDGHIHPDSEKVNLIAFWRDLQDIVTQSDLDKEL